MEKSQPISRKSHETALDLLEARCVDIQEQKHPIDMPNKSDGHRKSKGRRDSSVNEESSDGDTLGGNSSLKKGPWTSQEDAILVEYVKKHGEGNWNEVQKYSGLSRCGKSCRLRWANHLRPDLKKGAFSPEEERLIIELHARMGNKWARMAAELPGRTDNEIKNYWNTRTKKFQRAGIPLYPPDLLAQIVSGNRECQDMSSLQPADAHGPDLVPADHFEIPDVEFKSFPYSQTVFDIPRSHMLKSESAFGGLDGSLSGALPAFSQWTDHACEKPEPFGVFSEYDFNLSSSHYQPPLCLASGTQTLLNCNACSEPMHRPMKIELPSFQYSETRQDRWGAPPSPLPSIESVDTLFWSPPAEKIHSDTLSPRNSGLLEAVVYGSQAPKTEQKCSGRQSSDTSIHTISCEEEWKVHTDQKSPSDPPASSLFILCAAIGRSLSDEPGSDAKPEACMPVSPQHVEEKERSHQMDFTRPDVLLDTVCFGIPNQCIKD